MTVTVKKLGGSVAVVIPKAMAQELQLVEGTALRLTSEGQRIVIRRAGARPRRSTKEIVAQMNRGSAGRRRKELWNDAPVGKEIW